MIADALGYFLGGGHLIPGIGMIICWRMVVRLRDNLFMRQLEFFTRTEVAAMRDRTKARNYWAGREEFRRDHERHRRWGLLRRHARKLCRSHGCSRACGELGLHD